jgi:hypothetical protein
VMPESVQDRTTRAHEYVFHLTKGPRYFYDVEAVREEAVSTPVSGNGFKRPSRLSFDGRGSDTPWEPTAAGRNRRSVWHINPKPLPAAHFATMAPDLAEVCIRAATSERGVCPSCLAPYRRVVEPSEAYSALLGKDWADYGADDAEGRGHFALADGSRSSQRCVKRNAPSVTAEYVTKGWAPTCAAPAAVIERERRRAEGLHPEPKGDEPEFLCSGRIAGDPVPATVLDPFAGAGTTAMVAAKLGRDSIGAELNPDYIAIAERRIAREVGPLVCRVDVRRKEQAS